MSKVCGRKGACGGEEIGTVGMVGPRMVRRVPKKLIEGNQGCRPGGLGYFGNKEVPILRK